MGSGKSRWGARLATHFSLPFVDLDGYITTGEQQSIAEIFAGQGEMGFRTLEQKYLHALADQTRSVISLGGGTPCFFDNMDWVNAHGHSIYIKVSLDILIGRLQRKTGQRPLLAQHPLEEWPQVLGEMLVRRAPFYERAQKTVQYNGDDELFLEQLCAAAEI